MIHLPCRSCLLFITSILGVALSVSGSARADVLPPQECDSDMAGAACANAGPDADQEGICQAETCNLLTPGCDAGRDGGCHGMTYACVLCLVPGTGDAGSASGGDASIDGGASCAQLFTCCEAVTQAVQPSCMAIATGGNEASCANAFSGYVMSEMCFGGTTPETSAASSSPVVSTSSSAKAASSSSSSPSSGGCMTSPRGSDALDAILFASVAGVVGGAFRGRRKTR